MSSSGSVGTLSWSAKLDSNEFKKGVKNVKKQMKDMKKNVSKAFNSLNKSMAMATGAITGATGALAYMTKQSADLVNSQKILADSIGATQSEIAGLELASSSLGVSYDQMIDKMREVGGVDAFKNLANQVASATSEQEQMAIAQKALGNEGLKLLPVLQQGADGLKDFENQARKLGLALPDDKVNDLTSAWESLEAVQHSVQGSMRTLSAELAPVFDNVLSEMNSVLSENGAELKVLFETMADQFELALDGIVFSMEQAGIIDEASTWSDAIVKVAWTLENAFTLAMKGVLKILEKSVSVISMPFRMIFDQITDRFINLFKVAQTILKKLGQEVKILDSTIEGLTLFKDGFDAGNFTGAFDGLLGSESFNSGLEESWKRIEERVKSVRKEQDKFQNETADVAKSMFNFDMIKKGFEFLNKPNKHFDKGIADFNKKSDDNGKTETIKVELASVATAGSVEEFDLIRDQRNQELEVARKQLKVLNTIAKSQAQPARLTT